MKHLKKLKFNSFIAVFIALAVLIASFFGFYFKPKVSEQDINAANEVITTLKDANFDSSSSTSYPITPSTSNYTSYGNSSTYGNYGIINLDPTKSSKYVNKFPQNPHRNTGNINENYVLMLSSAKDNTASEPEYANVKNGFITTSGQINLEKDANYVLGVDVLTLDVEGGGIGALYLYDADDSDKVVAQIENISTVKSQDTNLNDLERTCWERYYFLISNNSLTSYNLKLGMFINGKGDVLFDNLSLEKVSESYLNNLKSNLEKDLPTENKTKYYSTIEKDTSNLINSFVVDDVNENSNLAFNIAGGNYEQATTESVNDGSVSKSKHFIVENNNVTFVLNKNLNLGKNKVYKITAYIKAITATNTSLNLIQTNLMDGVTAKSANITINPSSNLEDAKNGFVPYSFYVQTDARYDCEFELKFAVGSLTEAETKGSADFYVSKIMVETCAYKHYSSSDTNSTTLNMVTRTLGNNYFTNGDFTNIEIENYNTPYPAKPANWTVVDNTNGTNTIYGVINNSQKDELKKQGNLTDNILGAIPASPSNTNMLMLYTNAVGEKLSYISPTFSCLANSYYKFSARALAKYSDATLSLVTTVDGKEVVLASKTIHEDMFTNVNNAAALYLHTGHQGVDVSLKITVEAEEGVALAFLDDAMAQSSNENEFAIQQESSKKDLSFAINNTNFNLGAIDNAVVNITTLQEIGMVIADANDKNVLFIDATNPTSLTYTSNYGFLFKTDNWYKLSLSVYTKNLLAYNENDELSVDDANINFGLTSYEQFKDIKSENGFTTYTFYVKPSTETTSKLTFSLGGETHKLTGEIYIANIKFETIDEETFKKAPTNVNTMVLTTETSAEDGDNDSSTEEDSKNEKNGFNWKTLPYILSSLIFALSIVVAVVGVVSRKFKGKIKLPKKKNKTAYDRQKTVSKQVISREASIIKEKRITELNEELKTLLEERSTYEQEYKKDLTALRELKIKRANPNEINAINKELKKNQKKTAALGVNISRVESEIEYTKSNMYLANLMRKLERESNQEYVIEEPDKSEQVETKNSLNTTTSSTAKLNKTKTTANKKVEKTTKTKTKKSTSKNSNK